MDEEMQCSVDGLLIYFSNMDANQQREFLSALNEFMISSHPRRREMAKKWQETLSKAEGIAPRTTPGWKG
jgi:hypothetical protein